MGWYYYENQKMFFFINSEYIDYTLVTIVFWSEIIYDSKNKWIMLLML